MDLNLIKSKLESIQNKGPREKVDFSKVLWKPKAGQHLIRIVPSAFNPSNPFKEVFFHYGYIKSPILALTNWNEPDPIVEYAKSLTKKDPQNGWQFAKKLTPKMRVFVPIIVRGEEEMGVRLWEFGKETYNLLLNLAIDEDYGDYTSPVDGRDFKVDAVEEMMMGRKIIKPSLTPRGKTSLLSKDDKEVEEWTTNQPDILNIYKKYSYEELKDIFERWMTADSDEEETTSQAEEASTEDEIIKKPDNAVEEGAPWDKEGEEEYSTGPETVTKKPSFKSSAPANYSETTQAGKTKQSKADKFNDLFD